MREGQDLQAGKIAMAADMAQDFQAWERICKGCLHMVEAQETLIAARAWMPEKKKPIKFLINLQKTGKARGFLKAESSGCNALFAIQIFALTRKGARGAGIRIKVEELFCAR